MEIKTKFNVGDKVCYLTQNGEIKEGIVGFVDIVVCKDNITIACYIVDKNYIILVKEEMAFASRQEAEEYS